MTCIDCTDGEAKCFNLISQILPDLQSSDIANLLAVLRSDEFLQNYMRTPACTHMVMHELYGSLLQRQPDDEGLEIFKKALEERSLGSILSSIVSSDEFQSLYKTSASSNLSPAGTIEADVLVAATYKAVLEREPDPHGIEIYGNALRNGMTAEGLLTEFIAFRGNCQSSIVQTDENYISYLNIICNMTREMFIAQMLSQGCKIQLGPPSDYINDPAKLCAMTSDLLFTMQVIAK